MSVSSRPHSTGSLTSISISDRMSEGTSTRNSMASPALTTTLSTIAMQSGVTRIVIALLQSREKLELKILEMNPLLTYLGSTSKEAESMLVHHDDVLLKLQSKQSPVEELLKQADQLIATQRPRGEVYAAMADSLGLAWKDLNFQLEERRTLIYLNLAFFKAYEDCFGKLIELERDPQSIDFNHPRDSLGKMKEKRAQMLSALVKTLEAGQDLLGKLEEIGNNSDCDSRFLKMKSEAEFAKSRVEGWLEKLHDRRRILDDGLKTQREKMEEKIELDEMGRKVEKLKEEIGDVIMRKHYGMDKEETEVELKAVDSTLITIMTLQESTLQLTRTIESKRLKHWPTFPLKSNAYHSLDTLNNLVDTFENYKEDLNYTIQFYDLAQLAHNKLDELDKSEVLDDLSKFKKKLNEVTQDALSKGEILLDKFGWDDERTKGIRKSHDELIKRRDGMKKFEENLYITAVLSEYLEEFNVVFATTVEIEGWKNCEVELGTTRAQAEALRDATKEAIEKLKKATTRLRRFSLADEIKNELNEESAAELTIKTQGLNKSTKELEECLYRRLIVIENFITFLIKAQEIEDTLRAGRRINSPSLESLENVASKFIDSTQQCGGLHTVPAEAALRQTMADIGKKVVEVDKEAAAINARRGSLLETIQSLGKRLKDLRKEAFPILPDNAAGTDATSTISHVKIAKMNNLETAKKLQKDFEKTLPKIEGIDEGKSLKDECEIVGNFIVNYETLCMMLVHLYESLGGMEERINESFMYGKLNLKEISSAEKAHGIEHQLAVQELKAAEDYAIDIVALMKETEPPLAASIDESRLLGSVAGRSAGWDKFSRSQKATLDDMRASLLNHDFLQISSKLKDLLNHLTQSRGQYGETFRSSMEISEAFSRFEVTLTTVREKIEEFVEAAKEAKDDEDILEKKFELETRLSSLEQQTKERRRVIDLTLTYFTLSNDARGWLEEGLSLAKEGMEIKKRGKSANAVLLQNEISEFLSKGEDLQIERIRRVAQIASQLYGEEKSKTNEEMIRGENSKMIRELKVVAADLPVTQPEEAKFPILEITESIPTGEPELLLEERVKVEEGIPSTVLAGECKLTKVLTPSVSPCRQLVEKETQFESIEVTVKMDRDVNTQTVEKSSETSTQSEESTETIQEILTIVDGTVAPAFVTPLSDVAIGEGQRLSLQCKVVGVPKPKIAWLKDGMEIQGISDYKTAFDGSICSLTIEETFMPDSSIFTCRAENEGGMAETSGKLVVVEAQSNLSPPHIESKLPPNVTFKEASRGNRLECFVSGNPLPTVFWFRDGYSIDDSPDYVITFNNGKCVVNFDDVNLTHKGDYACRAVNKLGADETYSTVTVEVLEVERPFVIVPLCNVMARAGEKVVLLCELGGNPSSIEWFHDDRRIEFSPGVEKSLNVSAPSLTIKEAFPKHAGSYKLIARNAAGEASSLSTLTVKGRLPNETSDSDFDKSDMEVSRPKIQSPLRNTVVKEGDGFLLECIIVGNPEPEVIWFHNGEPIKESKDFQLKFQGDKCRLVVKEAFLEDGGDYRVNAINSAGEASSTCNVSVLEKEKMTEGPKFSKLIEDTMVDQGAEVVLSCILSEGWPKPVVTWYKNAVEIKNSDGYEIHATNEGEHNLKISAAQPHHRGNYMVKAKNSGGEAKAFASLIVKGEAGLFKEKEESESMTVSVMTSKRTIVHNESTSSIQQKLEEVSKDEEKDRNKSYEEKKALFERRSSNDGEIAVPSIIKVTRNKVGPRFISPINSLMVDEGTFVVLEGTLDGYPEPTVSWTKNDFRIDDTIPCNFCHGKVTLQIGKVKVKDGGRYACVAENSAGIATSVADLIVKKTTFPPVFGKRLQTQTVAPKKRIYMEVEVTGTPAPIITWFKDGRKVDPGGKIEIRTEGNRHVFILSDARAINSGQYMVKAVNDVGDAQSIADITVLDDDLAFSLEQPTKVIFESTLGKSEELGTKEVSVVYQMKQFGNSPKHEPGRPTTPKSKEFPKISVSTLSEKSRHPSWDQEPELVPEPPPIICYTPKPDSSPQKKYSVKAKAKTFENVQVTDVPGGVRILPPPSPPAVSISVPPFKPIQTSEIQGEFQRSSEYKFSSFESSSKDSQKASNDQMNALRIDSASPIFPKTPTSTPAPTPEQVYNIDFEENPLLPPPPEFREDMTGSRPKSLPLIKPSKFIPGEFKESDYESDFDAKIEPKWRPKSVTEAQVSSPRPLFQTCSLPMENECFEEANENVEAIVGSPEQEERRMKVKDLAKMWTREIELSYEASSATSTRTEYKKEETKLGASAVSPGLSRLSPIVFQEGIIEEKIKKEGIAKMKNVWPPPPSTEDSFVDSPKQTVESPSKHKMDSPSKHKIESPKQQKSSSFARVSTFEKMSQGSFKNIGVQGVSNSMMKPKPEKKPIFSSPSPSQDVQIAKSPFKPEASSKTPSSPSLRTFGSSESPSQGRSEDVHYYVSTVVGPTSSNAASGGLREEMEVVSTRTMTEVSLSTFTSTTSSTEGGGEGVKWPPWTSSTSKLSPKPVVPPKPSKGVSKTPSPINLPTESLESREDLLKPGTPPEFRFSPRPKSNAGEASFDFENCPWIVIPSPGEGDHIERAVEPFVPSKGRPSWACKERAKKIVPSKFVPGEVSESDYGSDVEEFRVRPVWAPTESESEDDMRRFRPVKPPQSIQQSSLQSMNLDSMGEYMSERAERSNRAFVRDIQPLVNNSAQLPRDGGNSGVVYFKYDFGYEFGLMAPQVGDASETNEGTPIPVTHVSQQTPK